MPYKDPARAKASAHARYLAKRDICWKNPDGTWKRPDPEKRRLRARRYYAQNKERIKARTRARRAKVLAARPTTCPICLTCVGTLVWDHCHTSGSFRGYICSSCNLALGHARDNPERLRRMARYLEGKL